MPDNVWDQFFDDFPLFTNFMTADGEKYEPQPYQESMAGADDATDYGDH